MDMIMHKRSGIDTENESHQAWSKWGHGYDHVQQRAGVDRE